jgi:hypothetical protein
MEKIKVSKRALKSLLTDSMREALGNLELPKPTKKVEKLLDKSSKRLAAAFVQILKKESRKIKKSESDLTYVEDVLNGKIGKKRKQSKLQAVEAI